jgi:hypothetical protein
MAGRIVASMSLLVIGLRFRMSNAPIHHLLTLRSYLRLMSAPSSTESWAYGVGPSVTSSPASSPTTASSTTAVSPSPTNSSALLHR